MVSIDRRCCAYARDGLARDEQLLQAQCRVVRSGCLPPSFASGGPIAPLARDVDAAPVDEVLGDVDRGLIRLRRLADLRGIGVATPAQAPDLGHVAVGAHAGVARYRRVREQLRRELPRSVLVFDRRAAAVARAQEERGREVPRAHDPTVRARLV